MIIGALVGALVCLVASPYLARLTLSAPDLEMEDWYLGRPASVRRTAVTAGVGVVTGALAGAAAGTTAHLPAFIALALCCTPLVVIDVELLRLPNRLVFGAWWLFAVGLVGAAEVENRPEHLLRAIEAGTVAYAVFFVLWFVAPSKGFGFGDVKLAGALGAMLGWIGWWHVLYGLVAGFVVGAFVGLATFAVAKETRKAVIPVVLGVAIGGLLGATVLGDVYVGLLLGFALGLLGMLLMLLGNKPARKQHVPFGPSMIAGAWLVAAFDLVPTILTG